ncbi:hypothetical protein BG003_009653 [Podila horticola]|nr:hypothetical protein BG003_009653 [Podila horticola]
MGADTQKTFNVLVLGETQSGKSTLIEYIRRYADPKFVLNAAAIGTGFLSHTLTVKTETVTTNLPEYYVVDKTQKNAQVNYGEFMKFEDEYDYEDALNMRKNLESTKGPARLHETVKFNLIDTPGLNATGGDDEKHVQGIFGELIATKTIHLLIITISSGPFTQGLQDAIRCYVDMFPDFNGIIAFVHTHFDYKNFHTARTQMSNAIELRMKRLHEIMGRTTFPHFKIDCDIYNKKPIRDCITQNTIQKILELATFNQPVDMLHTVINKTRKMRDIDNILRDKFEATSATIEKTLRFKVLEEGDLLTEIFRRETRIHKLDARIKVLNEYIVRHDIDVPEILHEDRRDMDFETKEGDKHITIRYPVSGELDFAINKRDLLLRNVEVMKEIGSVKDEENWKSWQGEFERTSPQNSVLHVKLYTAKANRHQSDIVQRREERLRLESELKVTVQHRNHHARQNERMKEQIKEIVENHSEGIQILGFVANEYLTPEIFKALMDAEAYIGDTAKCAKKVQDVYKVLAKNQPKQIQPSQEVIATNAPQNSPATAYSILCLGETQSGKSALIEHLKYYTDIGYTIDQTRLGDGIFPKTEETCASDAKSNLPPYKLFQSGIEVDVDRKVRDKDDLRDLLFSHDGSVELKASMSYLDDISFKFLDTPGLCNHEGKDIDHSKKIIDGILSTRSFNLILITVNFQNPLTAELIKALQYYSKVLEGLHNKIAFVFTHAGYDHYCHINPSQRLALAKKIGTLSDIFHGSASGDKKPYPAFAISLREKSNPVVQYFSCNTLRDVLMLAASNPPSDVMSREQIESIPHPSNSDDHQYMKDPAFHESETHSESAEQPAPCAGMAPENASIFPVGDTQSSKTSSTETMDLTAKTESRSIATEEHVVQESASSAEETPKVSIKPRYSVLVLGKTQAGKSTLVQHIKQYANPINASEFSILTGNTSRSDSAERLVIRNDPPTYEVFDVVKGVTLDPSLNFGDEDDYRRLLSGSEKDCKLNVVSKAPQDPKDSEDLKGSQDPTAQSTPPEYVEWFFLDSPGLDDTDYGDPMYCSNFASNILTTQPFNLILVTVSTKKPITLEYKYALEYYAQVLQEHPNVAILYTHVDYADNHHSNMNYHSCVASRHWVFSRILRGLECIPMDNNSISEPLDLYEYVDIDPNPMKRPAVQCLNHKSLREILTLATSNNDPTRLDPGWIRAVPTPYQAIQAQRDKCKAPRFALQMSTTSTLLTEAGETVETTKDDEAEKSISLSTQAIPPLDQAYPDHFWTFPAMHMGAISTFQTETWGAVETMKDDEAEKSISLSAQVIPPLDQAYPDRCQLFPALEMGATSTFQTGTWRAVETTKGDEAEYPISLSTQAIPPLDQAYPDHCWTFPAMQMGVTSTLQTEIGGASETAEADEAEATVFNFSSYYATTFSEFDSDKSSPSGAGVSAQGSDGNKEE